jgi:ABC-2 type transport system permease protein
MNSRKLLAIIRKELGHYFASMIGYVVLFVYWFMGGMFFNQSLMNRQASMMVFGTLVFILLFLTPLLTMRLWSEEEKNGTAELLKTAPLSFWEIIVGKYLGVCAFFAVMSAPTLIYLLFLVIFGNPDFLPVFANYLGYFLTAMAFLSLGLLASTMNENQIVSAVITFMALLFLWVIGFMGGNIEGWIGGFFKAISTYDRSADFFTGVIDLTHVFYFLSLIFIGLFFSVKVLEGKRS